MGLDIQIGALGAENENFKKRPEIPVFFFYGLKHQRKSDCGCTELLDSNAVSVPAALKVLTTKTNKTLSISMKIYDAFS